MIFLVGNVRHYKVKLVVLEIPLTPFSRGKNTGQLLRTDTACFLGSVTVVSRFFFIQRFQDLFRCEWRGVHAYTDRVVDRIGNGRDGGMERPFSGFFGAERPFGIYRFDNDRFDLRCIKNSRDLVFQNGRVAVQPVLKEDMFLKFQKGEIVESGISFEDYNANLEVTAPTL